ncbi:IMPACT family protein [Halobaculum magnesiiphilum]|uniref:IMPACT family protein n=1 Tax=Halobaculum magnesiiphilum TaxID=1017351 RepID=A0A8T8W9R3_9EURY|nr:YigZ family protein [Halobaculum magnesiiphilum]QZP36566.1 IMPACT family protein [Halobaculum magnesiiphilum]
MATPDPYRTVDGRASAEFTVQGSRFIGHLAPADTVEAAEAFIEEARSEYDDATHNVPAYRVPASDGPSKSPGEVMLREYSSDDGEPTGSAGKPALNVLEQGEVRNVVAVVTRYYGGTNLGVGGLARAYSRAVKDGLEAAGVVEEKPHEHVALTVAYDDSGTVRGILESTGVEFDADYDAEVTFEARVPVADAPDLRDRLRSATSGRVDIG